MVSECGACLMQLVVDQRDDDAIFKPQQCPHLFHHRCLQTWLTRDNSCPQCRCRVNAIHRTNLAGEVLGECEKIPDAFYEDEVENEDEPTECEIVTKTCEVRVHNPRGSKRRSKSSQIREEGGRLITAKVSLRWREMRGQIISQRERELKRRKAMLQLVDAEQVKTGIVKSLERLPFSEEQPPAQQEKIVIPTVKPREVRHATTTVVWSFENKKPRYQEDFLGSK